MIKRICPKCFTRWYSEQSSDEPWLCENCKTELPKSLEKPLDRKDKRKVIR